MPNDKINVGLVVVFFAAMVAGDFMDYSYATYIFTFLFVLFAVPLEISNTRRIQKKLGIVNSSETSTGITRNQYLLLYVTSGIIGSILNAAGVFFSMSGYILYGIDAVIVVACIVIHRKMINSPVGEGQL